MNSMSISAIEKIDSNNSGQFYVYRMIESKEIKHHPNNLGEGLALHPLVTDLLILLVIGVLWRTTSLNSSVKSMELRIK